MGDYTVLIISAKVKKRNDEEIAKFKEEILEKMPLGDSAYHATAPFIKVSNDFLATTLSMITQAKYGRGIAEFLDWLKPEVQAGIGPEEVWAIQYNEYSINPVINKMHELKDEDAW